jgi:hypothetical protein
MGGLLAIIGIASVSGCVDNHAILAGLKTPCPPGQARVILGQGAKINPPARSIVEHVATLDAGRHTFEFVAPAQWNAPGFGAHGGRLAVTLPLVGGNTYGFSFKGMNNILMIENYTTNQTIYYSPEDLVFFDEARKPVDSEDPFAHVQPAAANAGAK